MCDRRRASHTYEGISKLSCENLTYLESGQKTRTVPTEGDMWAADSHTEGWSTWPAVREMLVKPAGRYTQLLEWHNQTAVMTPVAGEDAENLDPLGTAGGNMRGHSHSGKGQHFLASLRYNDGTIQQLRSWAFTPEKRSLAFTPKPAHQCSQQPCW